MVDLAEIQAAYYMVAATGVLVAAAYYIINMRTNQRMMKTTIETRQIQLLKDFNEDLTESFTSMSNYVDMLNEEWSDFDDYTAKYSSRVDPEGSAYRLRFWRRFHFFGLMIRDGLIDMDTFMEYIGDTAPILWDKYRDIIVEQRVRYHYPPWMAGFEYIAGECNRYRVKKGWGVKTPDDIVYPSKRVS